MCKCFNPQCAKWKWPLIFAAFALTFGCGSPRRGQPVAGHLTSSSPQIELGRRVFMQHCHMCHPGGEGGLGPSINDKPLPGFAIRTQVRHGFGVMPEFGEQRVSPAQLDAVVAYLKALRQQEPNLRSSRGM